MPKAGIVVLSYFLFYVITPLCYSQTFSESCYPHSAVLVVSWETEKNEKQICRSLRKALHATRTQEQAEADIRKSTITEEKLEAV